MAAPQFASWTWSALMTNSRVGDFLRQCENPLTRELTEPILAYRIATPTLAWLLHLPPVLALGLQYLFSILTLVGCHRFLSGRFAPRPAFLLTLAIACSSTIHFTNWLTGVPDSLTHLATISALLFPSEGIVFAAVAVGLLNDERMILALPIIWLWQTRSAGADWSIRAWLTSARPVLVGLTAALSVRHALTAGWIGPGVVRPPLYDQIARQIASGTPWLGSWAVWIANWLIGPGWLWLIPAALIIKMPDRASALRRVALVGTLLAAGASSFIVADAARTIGFVFPVYLIAALWMGESDEPATSRLLCSIGALQAITPAVWVYQNWQWLQFRPLPWELKIFLAF